MALTLSMTLKFFGKKKSAGNMLKYWHLIYLSDGKRGISYIFCTFPYVKVLNLKILKKLFK